MTIHPIEITQLGPQEKDLQDLHHARNLLRSPHTGGYKESQASQAPQASQASPATLGTNLGKTWSTALGSCFVAEWALQVSYLRNFCHRLVRNYWF